MKMDRTMERESGFNEKRTLYAVPCMFREGGERERIQEAFGLRGMVVRVPGSKSITNRALLLATLAEGRSVLQGALFSDDSRNLLSCVQTLGFETHVDEAKRRIEITGRGGRVPKKEASVYVGSAGTAARFLSAYLGVSPGTYHLDASLQMRRRPMAPLLRCLRELGCTVRCEETEDHFPFTLTGNGFGAQQISVNIQDSSQFLSALLIVSVLARQGLTIQVQGSHGMAYIEMTERMMEQFGVCLQHSAENCYCMAAGNGYHAREYQIEPDVSAACYFYAMAPLLGIRVLVKQVHFDSLQGDVEFLRILERMGCQVQDEAAGIAVIGPADGRFHGVDADLSTCSDQAITLASLAPFADGPTTIRGIGHIRHQESDRMRAIVTELGKMGIACQMGEDFICIEPGQPAPTVVETYEDHRMAMGFSLIGLRAEGIVISNPLCCKKTFEEYFDVLDQLFLVRT